MARGGLVSEKPLLVQSNELSHSIACSLLEATGSDGSSVQSMNLEDLAKWGTTDTLNTLTGGSGRMRLAGVSIY
jgi:hypothetical protein